MNRSDVYKCELCGNIVEVNQVGGGTLVCCGQAMNQLTENTTEAATEKHIPVVEVTAEGLNVVVGSVEHPMVDDHWIQWIEVVADGEVYRKYLTPQDPPSATFPIKPQAYSVRAYFNLHGLWKAA